MFKLKRLSCLSFSLLGLFAVYILMGSCLSARKSIYFYDLKDDSTYPAPLTLNVTPFVDPKIEPNDVLAITIQTIAQNESNTPITTNSAGSFNALNGFLVDKNGYIELSLIGFIKVGGLTTTEARELVKQRAKEFYKEPVVNLRIANFDIYLLGDIGKPGVISSQNEKVSIIDAISLAGDLALTAKHQNILLVRTDGDKKTFVRFDVTKKSIFQSPYFYLKQRDLIYVEPNRTKRENSDGTFGRYFTYFSSLVSVLTILLAFKIVK